MFDKKIEFFANEDYVSLKEDYPIPSIINIPDWLTTARTMAVKYTGTLPCSKIGWGYPRSSSDFFGFSTDLDNF